MESREIRVAPDRFEISSGEALLIAELSSAIAVCLYDAAEEAGALLHLRFVVKSSKPADVTDTTLATELLLLDRCLQSLRELSPAARDLQAPQVRPAYDTIIALLKHSLKDAGVTLLPEDVSTGQPRRLRFRPSMGWVHSNA
jgi:chemotaxis receptor (MCP) glutamine deamidase CheD